MPLDDTETDDDCALVYYTTATKIETKGHMVPFCTCLSILADILCLSSVSGLTMEEITRTYEDQLWDPLTIGRSTASTITQAQSSMLTVLLTALF